MGVTRRTWEVLDTSKFKNGGRTSILVFISILSEMEISLCKSQRLKIHIHRGWHILENMTMIQGQCYAKMQNTISQCKVGADYLHGLFAKTKLVPVDTSIDGESGHFLSIVNLDVVVYRSKLLHWTILDTPLGNSIVYISYFSLWWDVNNFLGQVIHWLHSILKDNQ